MKPLPVSVLIPAKNEIANVEACLQSVRWADEVILIDSGSQDGTIESATRLGARVEQFSYVLGGPKKKNWALRNVKFRNDWILILDADERIPDGLASEIGDAIQDGSRNGYYINRRFWFLDRWIRHAGYFPSWNLRLIRKGHGFYEDVTDTDTASGDNEVHEHMLVEGSVGRLQVPMDHFAFPDVATFIEKHNRYSNWEARIGKRAGQDLLISGKDAYGQSLSWRRRLKRLARRLPASASARFLFHYVVKLGFLDGYAGYVLCRLLAQYEFWIRVKQAELLGFRRSD